MNYWPTMNEWERRAMMYWEGYIRFWNAGNFEYAANAYDNYIFWMIAATCGKRYAIDNFLPISGSR